MERCLREDPEALDHRTWQGKYTVAHNGERAATREEIGDHRGDIYRWVFDHNISALERRPNALAYEEIVGLLESHASPAQRLLTACAHGRWQRRPTLSLSSHPDVDQDVSPEPRGG